MPSNTITSKVVPVITTNITQKIAKLSHLSVELSDQEVHKYTSQLGAVLEYVEQLQSVDTGKIQALDGIRTCQISDLRPDIVSQDQGDYNRIRQNIIANFPNKQGNLLVLPGIFQE